MSAKDQPKSPPTFPDALAHAAERAGHGTPPTEADARQSVGRVLSIIDQMLRSAGTPAAAGLAEEAAKEIGVASVALASLGRLLHDACAHAAAPRPAALARFEGTVAGAAKDELPRADARKG